MASTICPIQKMESDLDLIIKIQCRTCSYGASSLFDETCRKNILHILSKNPSTTQLVLNHVLIRLYRNKTIEFLKNLSIIQETISLYYNLYLSKTKKGKQEKDSDVPVKTIETLKSISDTDPIAAYQIIREKHTKNIIFEKIFSDINNKTKIDRLLNKDPCNLLLQKYLRPYVRPGFVDSYLQLIPPSTAIFEQSYEIKSASKLPAQVNLYSSPTSIERFYYLYPPEFQLPRKELLLLEKVRTQLSSHHPQTTDFLHPTHSKQYFKQFAKTKMITISENQNLDISLRRIEELSDLFSQNTSGYGIIEYLLKDETIQDIYINAPVSKNPLHLVVGGEEYTSNLFISEDDVEALASRFRSLSGRPFSEASPVLDMDLTSFRTRIAAINNPLTPKGIAFALRRHRNHPWTLAHFIKNNTISSYTAGLLSLLIDGQTSLLIAGSRGAGKTSLLTALINEIPKQSRIISIEDTPEIPISILQNQGYKIQSLLTKSMLSSEESSEISPTHALRTALRLGESVLILGEVRGEEVKVLFESMRVGAAGNLIMGTIHGSTTQDVYERIVYDIGVSPSSFKAVEAVVIIAPIRKEGGFEKHRRVIQISETKKQGFIGSVEPDHLFSDLMMYDTAQDAIHPSDSLMMGQSELLQSIAKKWGVSIEKLLENIEVRAWMKQQLVDASELIPDLLEAPCVQDANTMFWMLLEQCKKNHQSVNLPSVKSQWKHWLEEYKKSQSYEH